MISLVLSSFSYRVRPLITRARVLRTRSGATRSCPQPSRTLMTESAIGCAIEIYTNTAYSVKPHTSIQNNLWQVVLRLAVKSLCHGEPDHRILN